MSEIEASGELLAFVGGVDVGAALADHLPRLVNAGVDSAPTGLIQDPAGVAIGSGQAPHLSGAGGASQAIYATFPDLEPIPNLSVGDSVLNGSTGPGERVFHTHSPVLSGDPNSPADVNHVLRVLTDVYARAIEVGRAARSVETQPDLSINLVPVSGRIFAGPFRDPALDHLHPSYTVTAVLAALSRRIGQGSAVADTFIWMFDLDVFKAAERSLDSWHAALAGRNGHEGPS